MPHIFKASHMLTYWILKNIHLPREWRVTYLDQSQANKWESQDSSQAALGFTLMTTISFQFLPTHFRFPPIPFQITLLDNLMCFICLGQFHNFFLSSIDCKKYIKGLMFMSFARVSRRSLIKCWKSTGISKKILIVGVINSHF